MTGFSHATTGIVIAMAVPHPLLSLFLAFISHFVLDRLPHWGNDAMNGAHSFFRRIILLDAVLGVGFVVVMMALVPEHWLLIGLGAAMATVPDLMWLPKFVRETRGGKPKPFNRLMHWHNKLQFERQWGIYTEAAWLVLVMVVLVKVAHA